MANDNQTALMQSIKRKKARVNLLREQCERLDIRSIVYERNSRELRFLEREITEDEKLLAVEKEQLIKMHITGQEDHGYFTKNWAELAYDEKYGTDGK